MSYYPEQSSDEFVPVDRKRQTCCHPSFKCSLCGMYKDNLRNAYVRRIEALAAIIEDQNAQLARNGLAHFDFDITVVIGE